MKTEQLGNSSCRHMREIISRSLHQSHHRSNNPLRAEPLTVQRINLWVQRREGPLSTSHNVVLIPADNRSALPVCFLLRERKRDLALVAQLDRPFRGASLLEVTDLRPHFFTELVLVSSPVDSACELRTDTDLAIIELPLSRAPLHYRRPSVISTIPET